MVVGEGEGGVRCQFCEERGQHLSLASGVSSFLSHGE